jgi:phosphatidylglycerophosphate synthase
MFARLRPLYNKIVIPIGKASMRMGFTPDFWTLFSLLTAALAGILLAHGKFWWGLVLAIVMYLADMLDGATARASGKSSKFGTVFDHVVDRYAEYIIISSLLLGRWISPAAAMFSSSGMIMASYVRAKAESAGGIRECTVGIAGRAEKLILMYGAVILLAFGLTQIAEYLIWAAGLISHITALQRLLYTRAVILKTVSSNVEEGR